MDEAPPCPHQLAYLLDWWSELAATRPIGFNGGLPITYAEISSWAGLTGRRPVPREVGLLRAIDNAFLRTMKDGEH